jgi:hypothetical protein
VGLFDWLPFGRKKEPQEPPVWRAYRDASDLVVEDGRGHTYRAPIWGARSVRIVANVHAGSHQAAASGWQVALDLGDGDAPIGPAFGDWRQARDLAQHICQSTELPLHELTERMFSQVGQFTPPTSDPPKA